MPRDCRKDTADGAMYSPQSLRRGKADFSATATERPARARRRAAVAPAGPPPMTRKSNDRIAARDEEVAEGRRPLLGQRPAPGDRPAGGELAATEPGAHADHGVVPRHVVAADEAHQAARAERDRRAPRLAGDEKRRARRGEGEQAPQVVIGEVVEKQVGDDGFERPAR